MMADFVRDHVGLGEIARRTEAPAQFVEERHIQIELAVGRAIERSHLGLPHATGAARRPRRTGPASAPGTAARKRGRSPPRSARFRPAPWQRSWQARSRLPAAWHRAESPKATAPPQRCRAPRSGRRRNTSPPAPAGWCRCRSCCVRPSRRAARACPRRCGFPCRYENPSLAPACTWADATPPPRNAGEGKAPNTRDRALLLYSASPAAASLSLRIASYSSSQNHFSSPKAGFRWCSQVASSS